MCFLFFDENYEKKTRKSALTYTYAPLETKSSNHKAQLKIS